MQELGVRLESVQSLQNMHANMYAQGDDNTDDLVADEIVPNTKDPVVGAEDVDLNVVNRSASNQAHLSRANSYESNASIKRSKSGYEKSEPYIYEKLMEGPYSYTLSQNEKKRILTKSKEINDSNHRPKTNEYIRSTKQQRDGKGSATKGRSEASRPHTVSPASRAPEAFGAGSSSLAKHSVGKKGRGVAAHSAAPTGAGRPKLAPLKVPIGFEGVAETIFEAETSNDIISAEGPSGGSDAMPRDHGDRGGAPSSLKKLSYAEKLQVMIMHVQEKM
jgi:hypothetical protein